MVLAAEPIGEMVSPVRSLRKSGYRQSAVRRMESIELHRLLDPGPERLIV
jgi:hypothetical protein